MLRICKNIVTNKDNFKGFVSLTDENFNKFTQDLTGYFKATQVNGNSWTYEFTPGTFYNYNGELIEWNEGSSSYTFYHDVSVYGGINPGDTRHCYLETTRLSTQYYYIVTARPGISNTDPYICTVQAVASQENPERGEITLDMIIPEVPNIIIEPL